MLDLWCTASVTALMEPDNEISKTFADLTALFEDAAELAAEGQSPGLPRDDRREIIRKLQKILQDASSRLNGLN